MNTLPFILRIKFKNQIDNIIMQIENLITNPPEPTNPMIAKFSLEGNYIVSIGSTDSSIEIKHRVADEFKTIQIIEIDDKNKINYLTYSQCGNYFITTTRTSIKVYKKMYMNTFDITQTLVGHDNTCIQFSPCGKYFIVGSSDSSIRIYTII